MTHVRRALVEGPGYNRPYIPVDSSFDTFTANENRDSRMPHHKIHALACLSAFFERTCFYLVPTQVLWVKVNIYIRQIVCAVLSEWIHCVI